jgi:EamA-like transporter family protein
VWSALACVYVLWGSTYLAIRVMVEDVPPLLGAGVRFAIAGTVMLAVLAARGRRVRVSRRGLRAAAIVGLLLLAGGNGLVARPRNAGDAARRRRTSLRQATHPDRLSFLTQRRAKAATMTPPDAPGPIVTVESLFPWLAAIAPAPEPARPSAPTREPGPAPAQRRKAA